MKNIQNQLLAVLTALICSFSIQAQDRVDWEDRADSTDIPSIGAIVTFVKEGSVAESKRIKPGDYIVSVNNHYFGFGKKLPETDYSMVVISGETGLRRTIEMEPEWAGFKYQSFYL